MNIQRDVCHLKLSTEFIKSSWSHGERIARVNCSSETHHAVAPTPVDQDRWSKGKSAEPWVKPGRKVGSKTCDTESSDQLGYTTLL